MRYAELYIAFVKYACCSLFTIAVCIVYLLVKYQNFLWIGNYVRQTFGPR